MQNSDSSAPALPRIGVIGGGQLALMLGEAARTLGAQAFTVLDPTPDCPATPVATRQIVAGFADDSAIRALAAASDIVTIEIEQVNAATLHELEVAGHTIHPSAATVALIQDKLRQKEFLHRNGIPVAPFRGVENHADLFICGEEYGYPFVLKARTQGYDGRGNVVVHAPAEFDAALEKLSGRALYAEQSIPFVKELAIMVARNPAGQIAAYPVVGTQHRRNICHVVIAPAQVPAQVAEQARSIALSAIDALHGAGIFGIELFLAPDEQLYINEIAPRPHNSGHYTIEACVTSQFEQHLRVACAMPPGPTDLTAPCAVMVNILGEDLQPHPSQPRGIPEAEALGAHVHLYGKHIAAYDRKMGHLTVTGPDPASTLERALAARAAITI